MNRRLSFFSLSMVLLGVWYSPWLTTSALAQERVRAKVGVQVRSGDRATAAKSPETVKAGDFLRVYVVPEADAYLYVIHSDGKAVTLLNAQAAQTRMAKGVPVALPSAEKFYQIDGNSSAESLTVICSPTEQRDLLTLLKGPKVSLQAWLALERDLTDKSKIQLGQQAEKPLQSAGNVRSLGQDPFVDTIPVSSGNAWVVKKYDFQVQK